MGKKRGGRRKKAEEQSCVVDLPSDVDPQQGASKQDKKLVFLDTAKAVNTNIESHTEKKHVDQNAEGTSMNTLNQENANTVQESKSKLQVYPPAKGFKPEILKILPMKDFNEIRDNVDFKPGTAGKTIKIESNNFRINFSGLETAYRYDVDIQPNKMVSKKMLRNAMDYFRQTYFSTNYPSYDGQKLLVSATKLNLQNDIISAPVTVKDSKNQDKDFKVTIKFTGVVNLSLLNNLLQKKYNYNEAFQIIEIVMRQAYVNSFLTIGRRFFIPSTPQEYPIGLGGQLYFGGYQAVTKGWIPFLNVDTAHKPFTKSITMIDLIIEMFSSRKCTLNKENLKTFDLARQKPKLESYLKNLKIVYMIPSMPHNKKVYKVARLGRPPDEEMFNLEGKSISVANYFQTKRNYSLKYCNLPTLIVGAKNTIALPIELCTLQEGQTISGANIADSQVAKIVKYATTSTTVRKEKIYYIKNKANFAENPYIQEFGLSIADSFEKFDARVLDPPELKYANGNVMPKNGAWNGKKFYKAPVVKTWTIVCIGIQKQWIHDNVNEFYKNIMDFGSYAGLKFSTPVMPFDYISPNKASVTKYFSGTKDFDLIFAIIPSSSVNKDVYYTVGQVAAQTVGCLIQRISNDTVARKQNNSTFQNILLKVNSKLNGINHVISDFQLLDEPTMVMGADVTHPSPQAQNIPSVLAVTASHNLSATTYNVEVDLQEPRTQNSEIIQRMDKIVEIQLRRFKKETNVEPKRIYFIRDGVSVGEFDRVRKVEIEAIFKGCAAFRTNYRPKLTFLVVIKRHNIRFFPMEAKDSGGDRNFNVPAGTCVDTVITDPTMQNFFLLSHGSIQGVSRPTKYCTLFDDNKLNNDEVQTLINYLCHVCVRCNRAISYPAPTYYAHLAADKAKALLYGKQVNINNPDVKLVEISDNLQKYNPMHFV